MNSNNRAAPHATIRPRSWLFAAVLLIFCASAQGADVLYIESSPVDPAAREQVKSAAAFLGLTLDVGPIQSKQDGALLQALHSPDLVAVIISADSLPLLDQKAILGSLQRPGGAVPLMISGVSERIDRKYLRQWSDGAVSGAVKIDVSGRREWYEVGTGNDVTRQLGGSQLPILAEQLDYLTLNRAAENLLLLTDHGGDSATPAFVRVREQNQSIFVAAENHAVAPPATPDPFRQPPMFASMAAL